MDNLSIVKQSTTRYLSISNDSLTRNRMGAPQGQQQRNRRSPTYWDWVLQWTMIDRGPLGRDIQYAVSSRTVGRGSKTRLHCCVGSIRPKTPLHEDLRFYELSNKEKQSNGVTNARRRTQQISQERRIASGKIPRTNDTPWPTHKPQFQRELGTQ